MTIHFSNLNDVTEISPPANGASSRPRGLYRSGVKRLFEVLLVLLSLPIVLPLILVLAALAASDGARPFYTQTRIGRSGRKFRMWKLRTMVPGADDMLREYLDANPSARAEWDATQKLKNDPRITRIGRFLRRSSIDELPQLWNVVNGTMSLVGPRPMMVDQQATYYGKGYYNLRPGITGMWQVSDRNESDFVDRIKHDDAYDREISFRTDASILMRTFSVVLRCTGY